MPPCRWWMIRRLAPPSRCWLVLSGIVGALAAQQDGLPAELRDAIAAVESELGRSVAAAERGELEAARVACRHALELARLPEASNERLAAMANVLEKLGKHADRLGDPQTTLAALGAVLRHREATVADTDAGLQALRNDVANAMHALGDLRGARDLKRRVLNALAASLADDAVNLQMARGSLASTLMELGDLDGALALQQQVLAVFTKTQPEDHAYVQSARMSLAMTLSTLGRLHEARELEQKVLAVRERTLPPDDLSLQRTRMAHAATLADLDEVQPAMELQQKVVDAFTRAMPGDHPYLLSARTNLATYLRRLGDLRGALAIQEEVLAAQTRLLPPDHPQLQRSRGNLASTKAMLGDPYGAFVLQTQVLEVFTATLPDTHPELQMARGNLAGTMHQLGDWDGAQTLAEDVVQAFADTLQDDHPNLRRARGNLANLLHDRGDLDRALALEVEVLNACEALPEEHPERCAARGNLASTLKALGRLQEALPLEAANVKALAARLPADHPSLLTARANHANTLRLLGQVDEALALLEAVLLVREKVLPPDHQDLQLTHCAIARAHLDRGHAEKAAAHVHAAATGALQLVGNRVLPPRVGPALAMQSARVLGLIAELLAPELALPESSAARLLDVGLRLVVAAENAELHAGDLRRLLAARDPKAYERLERELAVATQRLTDAVALPRDGRLDGNGKQILRDDTIRDATLAKDAIEREWLQLVGQRQRAAPETAALAARLAPHEVAIAFCSYPSHARRPEAAPGAVTWRYGAFVLAKNGRVRWHDLAAERDVTELVVKLRDRAEGRSPATEAGAEEALLAKLDAMLLAPLRPSLPAGTERLAVTLARDLRLIPIDVLPTAGAFDTQLVSSLQSMLYLHAERDDQPSLLVVGDVDYDAAPDLAAPVVAGMATAYAPTGAATRDRAGAADGAAEPKQFTALANRESGVVTKLFAAAFPSATTTMLRGRDASEAAVVAKAPGTRWLHVTTHGYFAPEPLWAANAVRGDALTQFAASNDPVAMLTPFSLTGLAFAGANRAADPLGRREGLLTAQEAAALDLSSCYLVTLSACESSLGVRQAGDGLASLRAAFHVAGARYVVASLWNVSDRATEQLMNDFYTRLWQHGDSPAQALRAAKQAARERRAPLREWAGWVVTGR